MHRDLRLFRQSNLARAAITLATLLSVPVFAQPPAADRPPPKTDTKQAANETTPEESNVESNVDGDAQSPPDAAKIEAAAKPDADSKGRQELVLVMGAAGADEFSKTFREWTRRWRDATLEGQAKLTVIGVEKMEQSDRDRLKSALKSAERETSEPLWIVFIGHGTFDGRTAKFNLQGRDVAAKELVSWLAAAKRPLVIINSASSSGPFINRLSAQNRIIVTATKSGFESNFARFGGELAEAIDGGAADLDKDGQSSLLEAFLTASARTAEFYEQEGRLATEHALLDDNADKMGTPATFFQGARATKAAKQGATVDGRRASQIVLNRSERERALTPAQRAKRDELEQQIAALRDHKSELTETVYYNELESLLVELSDVLLADETTKAEGETKVESKSANNEPPKDAKSR